VIAVTFSPGRLDIYLLRQRAINKCFFQIQQAKRSIDVQAFVVNARWRVVLITAMVKGARLGWFLANGKYTAKISMEAPLWKIWSQCAESATRTTRPVQARQNSQFAKEGWREEMSAWRKSPHKYQASPTPTQTD
jgi:hypothetical protein